MKFSAYRILPLRFIASFLTLSLLFEGQLFALDCVKKMDRIGLLEVSQVLDGGKCVIIVSQNDPRLLAQNNATTFKNTRDFEKRRYTFTSDGFLELYDGGTAQEIQFNQAKNPLSYAVVNNEVVIRLPGGQRINFAATAKGQKGIVKSFTGFAAASENSEGLKLTPAGSDTLLISPVTEGVFPHDKKNIKFSLVGSEGVLASFKSGEIFDSDAQAYPQVRSGFNSKLQNFKATTLPVAVPVTPATLPKTSESAVKLQPLGTPQKTEIEAVKDGGNEESIRKKNPVAASECSNSQGVLEKLDDDYLKIQGELTLSKLAYFYLKDSNEATESLEDKIKTLLAQKDLTKNQNIIGKKIKFNTALGSLKEHFLTTQKKWSEDENKNFLLADIDFKFISLVNEVEKKSVAKNQIINFVRMIDSSYRLSSNSKVDKLIGLEKRVLILNQKLEDSFKNIKSIKALCHLEAQPACLTCVMTAKDDNLSTLKELSEHQIVSDQIQWGSFWLHTGKKSKSPAGN